MALELEKVRLPIVEDIDLFLMYVNDDEKKYATYLAQELRMAGFIVDTEYTGRGLKAQFKQADRLNAKFICVLNSEDLDNNEVKIKNNKTKEEEIITLENGSYYLKEKTPTRGYELNEKKYYFDYSGAGVYRPEFERMLKDCENGKLDIVLCKSQSRFSRDMEIIEKYIIYCKMYKQLF